MQGDADTPSEPSTLRSGGAPVADSALTGESSPEPDVIASAVGGGAPGDARDAARAYAIVAHRLGIDVAGDAARIDRYSILERVGSGGMGVVYAAYDPTLDRRIALKLLPPERDDGNARARVLREARALAQLSHPNVVQVYEYGEFQGSVYLAVEFVRGATLRQWASQGSRDWRTILEAYLQAGDGLAAAHAAGLVHRDFKPDNAIMGDDGRVRVIDFGLVGRRLAPSPDEGLVRAVTEGMVEMSLTKTNGLVGTPAYMAPEQLEGREADARTDQFNFCASLYESLVGERAFSGKTPTALLEAMRAPPADPPASLAAVPAFVQRALFRGLRFDPDERFGSTAQLLAALRMDPRGRRRRWVLVGSLVAVLAAGLGGNAAMESWARAACAEPADAFITAWDDTTRARLRTALASSGKPFASTTARRVDEELDRWVRTWGDARTETCLGEEADGARSPELRDRSRQCLDDRALALEALVEQLAEPDSATAVGATRAAMDLPRVSDCMDDGWLAGWYGTREADGSGGQAELQAALARVRSSSALGAYARARSEATATVEHARGLERPATLAEALLELGVLERRMEAFGDSREHLEAALHLAVEARHDHLVALIASELVRTVGVGLGQPERAMEWGRLATAFVARTKQSGTLIDARLRNKLAMVEFRRGRLAAAEEHFVAALELRREILGPEHPGVAGTLANLGTLALEQGHLDRAETLLEQGLAIFEVALGPQHPKVGEAHEVLGRLEHTRGRHSQAIDRYQAALEILVPVLGSEHPRVVTTQRALDRLLTRPSSG